MNTVILLSVMGGSFGAEVSDELVGVAAGQLAQTDFFLAGAAFDQASHVLQPDLSDLSDADHFSLFVLTVLLLHADGLTG